MVERSLQLYSENRPSATVKEGVSVSIDHPHVLFDIPLKETLEEYITILETYYRPEQVLETMVDSAESPDRPPQFVFAQAIDEVLDLPERYHVGCAGLATDNTLGPPPEVESWEELASTWLWHYLSEYNRQLHDEAPDEMAELEESVVALQQTGAVSAGEIRDLVGYYLSRET